MGALVRQFAGVLGGRGLQRFLNLLTVIMLARLLSVADYGLYGLFVTTVMIATAFGNLGIWQAATYFIGQEKAMPRETLLAGLLVFPPLALVTLAAAGLWLDMANPQQDMHGWWLPMGLAIGGFMAMQLIQGVALGIRKTFIYNAIDVVPSALMVVVMAMMFVRGETDLLTLLWVFAVSRMAAAGVGLFSVLRDMPRPLGTVARQDLPALGWRLVRYGWPFALAIFLLNMGNWVGFYLIHAKGFGVQAGHFFAAWQFNSVMLEVANAVGVVFFAHGVRSKDQHAALRDVARLTSLLFWFMLLVGVLGMLVAPWALPLLLGPAHAGSVPFLQVMLGSLAFVTLSKILSPTLSGFGMPLARVVVLLPAVVLNAALSWVWMDSVGVWGAVYALVVSQVFLALAYLALIWHRFGVEPWRFVLPQQGDVKGSLRKARKGARQLIGLCARKG